MLVWLNCVPMLLLLIALAQLASHLMSFSPLLMELQVKCQFKHNQRTVSVLLSQQFQPWIMEH